MTLLKALTALLVLANLGYLLWNRGIAEPTDAVVAGAPQSLTLASESAPAPRSAAEASPLASAATLADAPPVDGSTGLVSGAKRCLSVGPFRDVAEAAHAASSLRGGGYDPRQRVADGEVWAGVWVYLPLPSSRASTDAIMDKLKNGGIEDALEMPGPNEGSVISLGLFSDPKRAQTRVSQAQALQLNPLITDRKRNGSVYWIDIDLKPADPPLNPAELQGEAGRIVRLEVKACPAGGTK